MAEAEDQQLILRWHYQESCLARNLRYLFESELFTDVTLSVGFQIVKAHRIVLASCSQYFLQLFKGIEPSQQPVIVLQNTSIEDLNAILSFVYRGQCIVSKSQLSTLLEASKTLKIQGLCDMKIPDEETPKNTSPSDFMFSIKENEYKHEDTNEVKEEPILEECSLKDGSTEKDKFSPNKNRDISTLLLGRSFKKKPLSQNEFDFLSGSQNRLDSDEKIKTMVITKKMAKDVPETCKCFICGKYLSNQYNLRVHMETHDEAYHACQSCPHVSRSRDALRKHVSYRHPEEYNSRKRKKTDIL